MYWNWAKQFFGSQNCSQDNIFFTSREFEPQIVLDSKYLLWGCLCLIKILQSLETTDNIKHCLQKIAKIGAGKSTYHNSTILQQEQCQYMAWLVTNFSLGWVVVELSYFILLPNSFKTVARVDLVGFSYRFCGSINNW